IMQPSGKRVFGCEAVVDGDDHTPCEVSHPDTRWCVGFYITDDPSTAVEKQQHFVAQLLLGMKYPHRDVMITVSGEHFMIGCAGWWDYRGGQLPLKLPNLFVVLQHVDPRGGKQTQHSPHQPVDR